MSTTVPKTPDQNRRQAALNRSVSAASASNRPSPSVDIGATEGVETLFTHPSGKIVKFTSSIVRPSSNSGTWTPEGTQQGTLPWATSTEKTMAAGPLEIYSVPGSVSFLHSGSLLHAILPRSNCWCVDGVSKFAMRVLPDTYYRIELPRETSEDLARVEEFKITLQKVLFYERTPCPFARTFDVDIPEETQPEPRRRRRRTEGPAKKWRLDRAYSWRPEGWTPDQDRRSDSSTSSVTASDEEGSSGSSLENTDQGRGDTVLPQVATPVERKPTVRDRARGIELRSVTAPVQMAALLSTPPSRLRSPRSTRRESPSRERSRHSSGGSQTRAGASSRPTATGSDDNSMDQRQDPSSIKTPHASISDERGNISAHRSLQPIPTDMPPSPPDSNVSYDFGSPVRTNAPIPVIQEQDSPAPQSLTRKLSVTDVASKLPRVRNEGVSSPSESRGAELAGSDQLRPELSQHEPKHPDRASTPPATRLVLRAISDDAAFVNNSVIGECAIKDDHAKRHTAVGSGEDGSLREPPADGDTLLHVTSGYHVSETAQGEYAPKLSSNSQVHIQHTSDEANAILISSESEPTAKASSDLAHIASSDSDPYAAIQARIQARRSIGDRALGVPDRQEGTRLSTISSSSSSSLRSQLLRRPQQTREGDQAVTSALVRKAASAFLGPPVHLVAIMLKIAARFAKGAFPRALLFESPAGMRKTVPGSFDLDDSDMEREFDDEDEDIGLSDDNEDDFGIPLRSPIRLASSESMPRMIVQGYVNERKGFEVAS